MTWDEEKIRESLKSSLDRVDVPIQIPTITLMRARTRRVASLGATVVIALMVGAAGAWGALSIDRGTPNRAVGPSKEFSLVRLVTNPSKGLIEIEASKGQACYRFEMRGVTSAHIHRQGSDDVLTDLPNNIAGNYGFVGCAEGLDSGALQEIVERPTDHLVEFHAAGGGSEARSLSRAVGETHCLPTEPTSPEYGLHFPATEGQSGDRIWVWGTGLRTEAGEYSPSDRLELWWNADAPDEGRPKTESQAIRLSTVSTENRCYFQTSFTVPDVPDGEYEITGFIWEEPASENYGVFARTTFTVGPTRDATADLYPLAAKESSMEVFAPSNGQLYGWCPQDALDLTADDLSRAEAAVLLAKDEISGGLNTDDAYATSVLASEAAGPPDFARMITRDCRSSLVERTVLVGLHLPKVESASMSAETYFVSKDPRGWVIWNMW